MLHAGVMTQSNDPESQVWILLPDSYFTNMLVHAASVPNHWTEVLILESELLLALLLV